MKRKLLILLGLASFSGFGQNLETFEGTWTVPTSTAGAGGPAGWAIVNIGGAQEKWELGTGNSYSGNHHAALEAENVDPGTTSEDWLISPAFTVPIDGQLSFYSKLSQPGNQGSTYRVMIKPAGSTLDDQVNTTNYVQAGQWTETQINPVQTDWTQKNVSLIPYVGQQVYIAFVMNGNNGDGWMIDNVNLTQSCLPPTNVVVTNISLSEATVSWTNPGNATTWDIEVISAGGMFTGNGVLTTANPYVITGIIGGETYQVCVRAVCESGEYSTCSVITFVTPLCGADMQCPYTFILSDTGADGWNGNSMSVVQNGATVATLALNSGSTETFMVPLCFETPFQLYWDAGGQNPEEVGLQVFNSFWQEIYAKPPGTGTQDSQLYDGMPFCSSDGCPVPYLVTAIASGTSATVAWADFPTGQWDYYLTEVDGEAPNSDTPPTGDTTTNPFTIYNLVPGASYKVFVRTNCADFGGSFNTDWSVPAYFTVGVGNFISGTVSVDVNADGICNQDDLGISGTQVIATIGDDAPLSVYTNADGYYIIDDIPAGTAVPISLQVVAPVGFTSPEAVSMVLDFPLEQPQEVNYCLEVPEGVGSDIGITLVPMGNAQAGFGASYAVIVQNNSPVPATGVTVTLTYPPGNVSLTSATVVYDNTVPGTVTYELDNIGPFGSMVTGMMFTVLVPPVNIGGEMLTFTAIVDMDADDVNDADNTNILNQLVVNAYDPNDITVHEGDWLNIDQAGEYLHYTIRFQNTGTAPAVNIRVENELDANLDWDTFDPITASHDYTVTRRNGNQLEFKFDNIFLDYESNNEPASHGFVTYRVKPKADIAVNDMVSSTADIYFDFNEPITTNTATTTFGVLGLNDQDMANISLYPNPVNEVLHINVTDGVLKSVQVYDLNGRLCLKSGEAAALNTQPLTTGLYRVRVETDKGTSSYKLIKQ